MKSADDSFTIDMLGPPKRGAPRVLHPLSPAKRQKARRDRLKLEGRGFLTAEVSLEILEEIARQSLGKKIDKSKLVEDILSAALFSNCTAQGAEAA